MKTSFDALPNEARLWVFVVNRPLAASEAAEIRSRLEGFTETWTSHTRPVEAATEVRDGRFVMVAAQIPGGDVSGCGTDKLFNAVEEALGALDAAFAPNLAIVFQDQAGTVQVVDRPAFRTLVQAGDVTPETPVFDASLVTLGGLREGAFTRPAGSTWLARYFGAVRA